mmetsp:Transcript_23956/g.66373  ORF Transcript_23956/g.66373 Transcript_23956/m.66373 type:complete len:210 (+) Transcript_23956:455-1084(+)
MMIPNRLVPLTYRPEGGFRSTTSSRSASPPGSPRSGFPAGSESCASCRHESPACTESSAASRPLRRWRDTRATIPPRTPTRTTITITTITTPRPWTRNPCTTSRNKSRPSTRRGSAWNKRKPKRKSGGENDPSLALVRQGRTQASTKMLAPARTAARTRTRTRTRTNPLWKHPRFRNGLPKRSKKNSNAWNESGRSIRSSPRDKNNSRI